MPHAHLHTQTNRVQVNREAQMCNWVWSPAENAALSCSAVLAFQEQGAG